MTKNTSAKGGGNEYAERIRKYRNARKLTQKEVADKLGISRASYIGLEKGTRELKIGEAEKLADIFYVSVNNIVRDQKKHIDKYRQMVLYLLQSKISKDGKVPKTKLAKLLYLADFAWYYKHIESMSGLTYRKLDYGPVPYEYFAVLEDFEENGKVKEQLKGEVKLIHTTRLGEKEPLNLLSDKEKKLMDDIVKKWKNKSTKEIVDFTHNQMPYVFCREDEEVLYEMITQEDPGYVY